MKIAYYLNEGRKKNLYCRVNDGTERVSFSLGYTVSPEEWKANKEDLSYENPYFFTLHSFKAHLKKRYHELKGAGNSNVLEALKNEADKLIGDSGIEGVARKMFDDENKQDDIPPYDAFIYAFEKHSGLVKGQYKAQTVDNLVHFYTNTGEIFEIDTYPGLSARLRDLVDRKSYDEIFTETDSDHWGEIYTDDGIEKHLFIPKLLQEWEMYWHRQYEEFGPKTERTDHLDVMKQHSWRQFQVFMDCYDSAVNIIDLAYRIDDTGLYPVAVITMLGIFDASVCYDEYCELEFHGGGEWESISLYDEDSDDEGPILHIRPYEA